MVSFPQLVLLSTSLLFPLGQAYFMETSCQVAENFDKVHEKIDDAFDLVKEVATLFDDTGIKQTALQDADTARLFKLLIGGDGSGKAAGESYRGVANAPFKFGEFEATKGSLTRLVFFCDTATFPQVKLKNNVHSIMDSKSKLAVLTQKITCKTAEAFTQATDSMTYIVLCPWTMKFMDLDQAAKMTTLLGRIADKWVAFGRQLGIFPGATLVDTHAKPYTTIFHELMHSTEAHDRKDSRGIKSYGWGNVVEIGKDKKNFENADNLMYFALAMRLKNSHMIVQDNGDVVSNEGVAARIKRALWSIWEE